MDSAVKSLKRTLHALCRYFTIELKLEVGRVVGTADRIWSPLARIIAPANGPDASDVTSPDKDEPKRASSPLFLCGAFAVWWAAAVLALYLDRNELFVSLDGGYMRDLARRQFEWGLSPFSASIDWFQGLGDVYFAVNFRLLPSFIVGSLFGAASAGKIATYAILLGELFCAAFLFSLSLRASRAVSIAAALATCITLLPFSRPTLIYGLLPLIPHLGSLIAGAALASAAFLRFGRRDWKSDLPFAVISFGLLVWSVLVSVTIMMLAFPFLLLCGVSGVIAAATPSERRCKLYLFAAIAIFLVAAGPAAYFLGTVLDTAAIFFPQELANNRASFYFASILFHWYSVGPVGPLLVIFAILGATLTAFDRGRSTLRIFGITLLTYLGTRLTFAVLVIVFDFWRGPAALYFEFYVIPLYAVFAALFFARVFGPLWRCLFGSLPSGWRVEAGLFGTAIAIVLALAANKFAQNYGFPYPPKATAITDILAHESGQQPGSVFRGRTANMTGTSIDRSIDWLDLHVKDYDLSLEIGNEMRLVGLNYFGIPSLFEYTSTLSPFFYALTSRLLALPVDRQMRTIVVLRHIDPRILAMLGVRFLITDQEYDGPVKLRASEPVKGRTLFLYEIAAPNVGDYSPIVVSRLATASEIIARMANEYFDPGQPFFRHCRGRFPSKIIRVISGPKNATKCFDGPQALENGNPE
ncbi:MAG: hypothetical protein WB760_26055 [Xanthobacteraceae bacterium]